ncbi:hypothetical protein FGSG_13863 [Fusarium graminearum PH-1]|uniref:Chromosome 3, complete genome n=1 Tax=Gibberella zeae (strain ATCC MYA-4620 / CBS 123657 / FGSC 9075 / NRRL 31084 / PH-1) TaxID=229533 RepID=I1SAI2_GIBZE|nr:hypothetical protein FGSG_13863 [Fusarium graminearum PH-1]ESU17697.1 hypothetical protein FGSG_13863 [Fusarium graminearum PH-1]CEF88722.1 unnamed protein product [Fusarium graminearum]|eukprot:XP_011325319.1 hypothetical protein FGSG_13863 [Fusarium graminearum PH-1]
MGTVAATGAVIAALITIVLTFNNLSMVKDWLT